MRLSGLFLAVARFFLPPAIITTLILYFHAPLLGCGFAPARAGEAGCLVPGQERDAVPEEVAPFRLLALADPQLEGDSSLPDPNAPSFPSLHKLWSGVQHVDFAEAGSAAKSVFQKDVPALLQGYRKHLDLWGNDLYLAHLYRTVSWWTQPTHTVVLGDLLGSQWISDGEFKRRSTRFWKTVFKGGEKVPRRVTDVSGRTEVLGQDKAWKSRIIAVAGNHDIGYAGDIDENRIERFEDMYGSVSWEVRFTLENSTAPLQTSSARQLFAPGPAVPELHLVIVNSMNLDEPALKPELLQQSREFVDEHLHGAASIPSSKTATVMLTHIPLHKDAGVCVDPPFFDYFPSDQGGGIKEQNHLSQQSSHRILNGLVGPPRLGRAIVLNGHDHEGCDTYHSRSLDAGSEHWDAKHYALAQSEVANVSMIGVREITVRSMMGSFDGNAGFLSGWFDRDAGEWKFEYSTCPLGVQHIWWGVHVFDLVVFSLGLVGFLALVWEELAAPPAAAGASKMKVT